MARGKYELHIYWDDDATIECRYFDKREDAETYAKRNGCPRYMITKEY